MSTILLNPGPVTLSRRVREALGRPDMCHRESEFGDLQDALRRKLLAVYDLPGGTWAPVLVSGSGTAAVEAMITSCVPAGGRLLVVDNGVYGARLATVARANGIEHHVVAARWTEAVDVAEIERTLRQGAVTHVAVVHHETTTGRLNDLAAVGALAATYGARLLVDGVSSFGAEWIDFDGWSVDACAGSAGKCLHGVPGAAFVMSRRAALLATPARSVYLDLAEHLAHQDARQTAFTPPLPAFHALDEALDEFAEEGGWSARRALFSRRIGAVREVVLATGCRALLPEAVCSCVLHSFEIPRDSDFATIHDALKADGFVVYAGQGALSERTFRVSTMGDISRDDLHRLLESLRVRLPR